MTNTLGGKAIVIIGGTTGLGLSAAKAFVGAGARVVCVGRNNESCRVAGSELGKLGDVVQGDASIEGTAQKAIDLCITRFGSLDGLYHVAGGSGRSFGDGPLHELSREGWDKTLTLNLTSLMLSNQAAVRYFMERKTGGSILNMSSVLGYSPSPRHFSTHAYAAAKSAVLGFTKAIASYYAKDNIRVNVLAPALVDTPMAKRASADSAIKSYIHTKQPLDGGRTGIPADLDGAAVYFMSDQSKFTTGQVLAVDGGWTVSDGGGV